MKSNIINLEIIIFSAFAFILKLCSGGSDQKTTNKFIYGNAGSLENIYISYIPEEYKYKLETGITIPSEESFCNLPVEKKLALCGAIFSAKESDIYRFDPEQKIYINKTAFSKESPKCENISVLFENKEEYNGNEIYQSMFPCYGRHNPVRTQWNLDEYLRRVYVSSGCNGKCVFVYIFNEWFIKSENSWASLKTMIENFDVTLLDPVNLTDDDIKEELASLNQLSYNILRNEIEMKFILEHKKFDAEHSDQICPLSAEKKLTLCKKLFTRPRYTDQFKFSIYEPAFSSTTECNRKKIYFAFETEYNMKLIHRDAFLCYGINTDLLNDVEKNKNYVPMGLLVSQGYRKNSVLVIANELGDDNKNIIVEFIENVDIDNLQPTQIPPSAPPTPLNNKVTETKFKKQQISSDDNSSIGLLTNAKQICYGFACFLKTHIPDVSVPFYYSAPPKSE